MWGSRGKFLFGVATKYPFRATRRTSLANCFCSSQAPTCSITAFENTQSKAPDLNGNARPSPAMGELCAQRDVMQPILRFNTTVLPNEAWRRWNSPRNPAPPPTSRSVSPGVTDANWKNRSSFRLLALAWIGPRRDTMLCRRVDNCLDSFTSSWRPPRLLIPDIFPLTWRSSVRVYTWLRIRHGPHAPLQQFHLDATKPTPLWRQDRQRLPR